MTHNLLTLLSTEHTRMLQKNYHMRLAVVAAGVLVFVLVAHTALLVPAYVYGKVLIAAKETELATLTAERVSEEEREVDARSKLLASDAAYLSELSQAPTASNGARALLAVSRPGILISGITFTAAKGRDPQKMTLSGIAETRTALRQYVNAVRELPGVSGADVPISTYAQESAIQFTITLTGSPTP